MDTRYYHFEGFIPVPTKERKIRLEALKKINETIVIYEAPHRLMKTIEDLCEYGFSGARAAFCRELTKKYEQVIRLTLSEARSYFEEVPPKGEFVICLEPVFEKEASDVLSEEELEKTVKDLIEEGLPTKEISKRLAPMTDKSKKELYSYITNLIK